MLTTKSATGRWTARLVVLPVAMAGTLALTTTQVLAAGGSSAPPSTAAVTRVAVSADRVLADANKLVAKAKEVQSQVERDTSPTASRLIERVRQDLSAGRVPVHLPPGAGVAGGDALVFRDAAGGRAVYLPYTGAAVRPSGLTVVFDVDGNRTATSEQVFQAPSANSAKAAGWVNGVLRGSVLVDASGAVTPSAEPSTTDARALQSTFYQRFNNCLSAQGVPSAIVTAISIVCGFVCVGTAGLGCFACLGAAAGAFAGIVDFCIRASL